MKRYLLVRSIQTMNKVILKRGEHFNYKPYSFIHYKDDCLFFDRSHTVESAENRNMLLYYLKPDLSEPYRIMHEGKLIAIVEYKECCWHIEIKF